MLGETYDRFIAGEAVKTKTSPLYLPDDNKFHGIGKRAQYKMDSYWDTNHVRPLTPSCNERSHAPFAGSVAPQRCSCRARHLQCVYCPLHDADTHALQAHAAPLLCRLLRCTMRPASQTRRCDFARQRTYRNRPRPSSTTPRLTPTGSLLPSASPLCTPPDPPLLMQVGSDWHRPAYLSMTRLV